MCNPIRSPIGSHRWVGVVQFPNDAAEATQSSGKLRPNGGKKIVRGRKRWLVQGNVPIIHRTLGSNARQKTNGKADQNAQGYVDNSFFHGWHNFD